MSRCRCWRAVLLTMHDRKFSHPSNAGAEVHGVLTAQANFFFHGCVDETVSQCRGGDAGNHRPRLSNAFFTAMPYSTAIKTGIKLLQILWPLPRFNAVWKHLLVISELLALMECGWVGVDRASMELVVACGGGRGLRCPSYFHRLGDCDSLAWLQFCACSCVRPGL